VDLQLRLPTNVRVPTCAQVMQQQGLQWASQAVAAVPETALSASDRQKLLGVMQVTAIEGPEARNYGWVFCCNRHPHALQSKCASRQCALCGCCMVNHRTMLCQGVTNILLILAGSLRMSLRTCLTPAGGTGAFRMQHSRRSCLHLCMRNVDFVD
jgi:hypothetical protein